jgi:hypothetical protein
VALTTVMGFYAMLAFSAVVLGRPQELTEPLLPV